MQIRAKIKLIGISLVLFAGIMYSFIFWHSRLVESERQKEDAATQTVKILFEMDTLLNEYLLYPSQRSINQWQDKHKELEDRLSTDMFEKVPAEQELVDKMKQKSSLLRSNFEELVVISKRGTSDLDTEIIRNRLVSQLSASGNKMVETALLLTERLRVREAKIQVLANSVGILIIIIALLIGYFGSRILVRNILSPLNELSNFAKKISHGKFDAALSPALLQRGDEFSRLGETFQDMAKNLEDLDKAKTEFISIASHQLRTPVSGLNWITEALQFTSQNLTPKQQTYVKDLSMLSKRLIVLVEDLLNLSRIQLKSTLVTEKNLIDAPVFIEEFIKEIESYASSKKHTVVFNKSIAGPLTVEINKKSLYNILQNLISNAIEYSPENTAVTVNLKKTENFIKVSIANKGPVIPKDEQSHIFGRFYRGESAKKMKVEGTGLGLYIVKTIIEDMGGKVGFESPAFVEKTSADAKALADKSAGKEEGTGTMFWFTIPLKMTNEDSALRADSSVVK